MNCTVIFALFVFVAAASACGSMNDDPGETDVDTVAAALSTPTASPGPTATPAPAPTSAPTPEPTATKTPAPTSTSVPEPTATATSKPLPTPNSQNEVTLSVENTESIAYIAILDLSDQLTESELPVSAHLTGWMTIGGDSQVFMQVDMSQPVDKSFEVLLSNSFDVHLRDIEEDRWFFIPENSDTGPLEDILSLVFVAHAFSDGSGLEAVRQVEGGYIWKVEDTWGSTTAVYDEEYLLREFLVMDTEGRALVGVTFHGHGQQYSASIPEKGKILPEGYWGSP